MSRYKKSEYRAEPRKLPRPSEASRTYVVCQGGMGLCDKKKDLTVCGKCGKPFCGEHKDSHPAYCLGVGG
jgi:hypothetical protein